MCWTCLCASQVHFRSSNQWAGNKDSLQPLGLLLVKSISNTCIQSISSILHIILISSESSLRGGREVGSTADSCSIALHRLDYLNFCFWSTCGQGNHKLDSQGEHQLCWSFAEKIVSLLICRTWVSSLWRRWLEDHTQKRKELQHLTRTQLCVEGLWFWPIEAGCVAHGKEYPYQRHCRLPWSWVISPSCNCLRNVILWASVLCLLLGGKQPFLGEKTLPRS